MISILKFSDVQFNKKHLVKSCLNFEKSFLLYLIFPKLSVNQKNKQNLDMIKENNDVLTESFDMALHYEFIRLLSIEVKKFFLFQKKIICFFNAINMMYISFVSFYFF